VGQCKEYLFWLELIIDDISKQIINLENDSDTNSTAIVMKQRERKKNLQKKMMGDSVQQKL
jgi:hypothetical protein